MEQKANENYSEALKIRKKEQHSIISFIYRIPFSFRLMLAASPKQAFTSIRFLLAEMAKRSTDSDRNEEEEEEEERI